MTDSGPHLRTLPTHLSQMLTITKYEMLKYLRSRRLIGCIAVILLIVGLIYSIPPLVGMPYSGHITQDLQMIAYGPFAASPLNHSHVVNESIVIHVNGTELPRSSLNWSYNPASNSILLYRDNASLAGKLVVADFDFKDDARGFAESFMQFNSTLIIILVTFFGADALVSEYQTRTAYLLFPNPIKKEIMFAGKFLASFLACMMMLSLFFASIVILSVASISGSAYYLPLSFAFATLFLVACLAVSFFISSLMKGSTGAIIFTFFLLLMILPIVQSIGMISGTKMWFMLTFMGDLPTTALRWDHYPVDSSDTMFGFTYYNFYPDPLTSVIAMIAYILIFIILSVFLFKRKELTG